MNARCIPLAQLSVPVVVFVVVAMLVSLRHGSILPRSLQLTFPTGSGESSPRATPDKQPHPLTFNQLTVDEMAFSVFGEPINSSHANYNAYLSYVRSHIAKPSPLRARVPLNSHSTEFSVIVDKKLKSRRNGFFIECGAAEGYSSSQTLFLEMERNWTGLLVEANQRFFRSILGLNRQAYVFGGCLSPERRPRQLQFDAAGYQGGLQDQLTDALRGDIERLKTHESTYLVQCFPVNDLLAAIGVNHVDFFMLDVQGAEPAILQTIDFKAIRIDVILVGAIDYDAKKNEVLRSAVKAIFEKTGLYKKPEMYSLDMLFERNDL